MAPIIQVRDLGKQYELGGAHLRAENFREFLLRHLRLRRHVPVDGTGRNKDFWALKDVNLNIEPGDVVGIIGRNGAGKSTLLKILSRITDPTEGEVTLRGRMASLLEVGTGFHPELTGRENIFLNGAILGMRRHEIASKFDEITAFSEVEKFLDTPVKYYSSGMYVRLAFAVAAHLNPEILVVDEVLAVGDVTFQKKCLGKMSEVSRSGRTVIFVSHNMAAIENLCRRGVVLQQGRIAMSGTAEQAVEFYLRSVTQLQGTNLGVVDLRNAAGRSGKSRPLLQQLEFLTENGLPLNGGLRIGAPLKIRVHFPLDPPTANFDVGIGFNDIHRQRVFTAHSFFEPQRCQHERSGPQVFVCDIPSLPLVPGSYSLRVWLDIGNAEADLIEDAASINVVESDYYGTGKVPWNGTFVVKHNWYLEEGATTR
jgi:lipopolysaccharide transport system ATP-binding protein